MESNSNTFVIKTYTSVEKVNAFTTKALTQTTNTKLFYTFSIDFLPSRNAFSSIRNGNLANTPPFIAKLFVFHNNDFADRLKSIKISPNSSAFVLNTEGYTITSN
ncbi:hypothetical protein C5749_04330 [Sphingobacterium gobiense]|uniref:Uncharacterized protein n=1 Tax=Sphingobacterium gobiense TaxID=1382456 RepID=A0A2S9JTD7_9SPHI|nr:hypothetical protein C5749_04330 [Sphingobacterium gobiense]